MSQDIRTKAEASLANVEKVTAVVVAEPGTEIVTLDQADATTSAEITKRISELDMSDTNSIVRFGSSAQAELQ